MQRQSLRSDATKHQRMMCVLPLELKRCPLPLGCEETLREDEVHAAQRQRAAVSRTLGHSDEHGMIAVFKEPSVE